MKKSILGKMAALLGVQFFIGKRGGSLLRKSGQVPVVISYRLQYLVEFPLSTLKMVQNIHIFLRNPMVKLFIIKRNCRTLFCAQAQFLYGGSLLG